MKYINAKLTGHQPVAAMNLFDRVADYIDQDTADFCWSGNIDATHIAPAGSSEASRFSPVNGKQWAQATVYYRA